MNFMIKRNAESVTVQIQMRLLIGIEMLVHLVYNILKIYWKCSIHAVDDKVYLQIEELFPLTLFSFYYAF